MPLGYWVPAFAGMSGISDLPDIGGTALRTLARGTQRRPCIAPSADRHLVTLPNPQAGQLVRPEQPDGPVLMLRVTFASPVTQPQLKISTSLWL